MKRKIFNGLVLVACMYLSTSCQFWALDGNPGTNPNTNFVGTSDKQPLNIKTDNKTAIHIDTESRVGIGTTHPKARLEVTGGGRVMIEGGQRNIMSNTYLFPQSDPNIPHVTPHHFLMVLSSDPNGRGDLHFGKTDKIDATTNVDYSALIDGKTNEWHFFRKVTLGPIDSLPKMRDPTARLSVEGNICATGTITGNQLTCNSSRILKEKITSLSKQEAIATLMDLEPVTFYYKSEKQKDLHLGFIAEDVPDLVATSNRKSLSSMDIVAVLTKVVQQQQKKIEALEARFAEAK